MTVNATTAGSRSEAVVGGPPAALRVRNLTKAFGPHVVLRDVDMCIKPGHVRALVGLNGSGKSTLIKILSGYHHADTGSIEVAGRPLGEVHGAGAPAIRFLHQDLALADGLNAVDNIALGAGYARMRTGMIGWRHTRRRVKSLLASLGYDIDPHVPVGLLTPAERTGVAIARALADSHFTSQTTLPLLVLDEPTAALPSPEVERLFRAIRTLTASGSAVLYVTHHLDEIFELADSASVLRNGRLVADLRVGECTPTQMVEAMTGRASSASGAPSVAGARGEVVVQITALRTHFLAGVDLTARRGEIVGVAGLTGSGREELAPALLGLLPRAGSVVVEGTPVPPSRPHRAVGAGLALVPAKRITDGLWSSMTLCDNVTLGDLRPVARYRILSKRRQQHETRSWMTKLDVRPMRPQVPASTLSGGNQQKIVLSRWLRTQHRALILDEPTQGVDVEARKIVYRELREAANRSAIIVCSSDSQELAQLCDRVVVLRRGRIAAELKEPLNEHDIATHVIVGGERPRS